MTSYRAAGKRFSPALERLARQARANAQSPRLPDAEIRRRLELAIGAPASGPTGLVLAAFGLVAITLVSLGAAAESRSPIGQDHMMVIAFLIISTIAAVMAASRATTQARNQGVELIEAELAWATKHPFPVDGYREWIVANHSVMRVALQAGFDRDTFIDAVKAIDRGIEAKAIDEHTFQLTFPVRTVSFTRFGNIPLLKAVFAKVLTPLHTDVGIEHVVLGGTIEARA